MARVPSGLPNPPKRPEGSFSLARLIVFTLLVQYVVRNESGIRTDINAAVAIVRTSSEVDTNLTTVDPGEHARRSTAMVRQMDAVTRE